MTRITDGRETYSIEDLHAVASTLCPMFHVNACHDSFSTRLAAVAVAVVSLYKHHCGGDNRFGKC